ncbi:hypothetical protein N431DRAFT_459874 [Stipitochalara longipes BDJ]|nr:hypothetical protein N431DRAFT_459874 [Stipitochalara longipes BDJ]
MIAAQSLSSGDAITLATLIVSIPSVLATIIGAWIGYRSLKQFNLGSLTGPLLPLHHTSSQASFSTIPRNGLFELEIRHGMSSNVLDPCLRQRSWSV